MYTKTILFTIFICLFFSAHSQKEWSNWYFSSTRMMTFGNGKPELKRDFIQPVPTTFDTYYGNYEKGISYSDPVTGEMKFLVSSIYAYNKNFKQINTQEFLRVCPGNKYGLHIIPFSGNPNKFYIIQHQTVSHDQFAAQTGLQVRCPNSLGLTYSVLDMAGNNGNGMFESINNRVQAELSEGIALVRHANGKDVWVVVHSWGDNKFWAYLFSDNGVSQPVVSAIGPLANTNSSAVTGHMIAAHNGSTIAVQSKENHFIERYDFDKATGTLSNFRTLPIPSATDGLQFSPDDSKLYFVGAYWTPGIYQFDFNATDVAASLTKIAEDPSKHYWDMQLGPDGKIYIANKQFWSEHQSEIYLSVINCPNLPKYAANFVEKGFETGNVNSPLPTFINDFIRQPKAPAIKEFSLGKDTAVCFGTYKLAAPEGWEHYRWNTGATTRELTVTEPGLYYVLAGETGFSCPTAFGSISITNAARPLNLGNDTSLCPRLFYTLKVPANFSHINWEDGETLAERHITESGIYRLRASDENGCANRDTIEVSIKREPVADFGSDTTLCNNQTLLLELKPEPGWWYRRPPTYRWQNNSDENSQLVTQPGTYWGEVTYNGCTIRDTISVHYISTAGISLGLDTVLCAGDSLKLLVNTGAAQVQWSNGVIGSSITVKDAGIYWVKVDNGTCALTDTIEVRMQPRTLVSLGADTILCNGQVLLLQPAAQGAAWTWQDGSAGSSYTVTKSGLYWVKATVDGCSSTDSVQVSYKPLPPLNMGRDTGICSGQVLKMDVGNPTIATYKWQDGTVLPIYNISKAGTYQVTATGTNGCVNRDTIEVTVSSLPQFSFGADTSLCAGSRLLLQPGITNVQYRWNDGSTGAILAVGATGEYWAEVSRDGCFFRDSIRVNFKPLPEVAFGNDTTLCEGSGKWLDVTAPGASYRWQNNSTSPKFFADKPGLYFVVVTSNGCSASDSIRIGFRNKPRFSLGADTVLCTGQQLQLNPGGAGASIRWQDGSGTKVYTVRQPGTYSVSLTNECGSTFDEIVVRKGLCQLFLPNAFTPNQDGKNELFRVKEPGFIRQFHMRIYNRWGGLVYESANAANGWNGKFKGIDQPDGAYIWQVELVTNDGIAESAKGTVLLFR